MKNEMWHKECIVSVLDEIISANSIFLELYCQKLWLRIIKRNRSCEFWWYNLLMEDIRILSSNMIIIRTEIGGRVDQKQDMKIKPTRQHQIAECVRVKFNFKYSTKEAVSCLKGKTSISRINNIAISLNIQFQNKIDTIVAFTVWKKKNTTFYCNSCSLYIDSDKESSFVCLHKIIENFRVHVQIHAVLHSVSIKCNHFRHLHDLKNNISLNIFFV